MERNSVGCQVCLFKFKKIHHFSKHLRSNAHKQKMKEIFQQDIFKGPVQLPYVVVMGPSGKREVDQPIIGLSLVTVCFSLKTKDLFYLCRLCEEKHPSYRIKDHLSSSDHCSNYFNYTNPNVLRYSWLPSMNMSVILRPELKNEVDESGPGELQMLDLPEGLWKKLEKSTYSEVMCTFRENDKLLKLLEVVIPERTTIQTYQKDSNRKHPLLGMQLLVECICVGATEKRFYFCTLCKLILSTHQIIKHVLSFDHIFYYFTAWHPSTLQSKLCYKNYTKDFASMMLDFAKQTEEIHGAANTDMKQVTLEPDQFRSELWSTTYAKALKELESITKENVASSLIASVKPGIKLECRNGSAQPFASLYKPHCQNCNITFKTVFHYSMHVKNQSHKQMLMKFVGKAGRTLGYDNQEGMKSGLALYRYLIENSMQNQPAVGVALVVTCASTQVQEDPIYLCFACEDCFPESLLGEHFNSLKHLIQALLYLNPWRLPFAWENHLDVKALRSMAWEEEKERGPDQKMLKVLDVPYGIFQTLIPPTYPKVMKRLQLNHSLLKCGVPQRETYSKLKQNKRFPLLGKQFLVMHMCDRPDQSTEVGFLCLLCEKRLSDDECYAHVFSWEHVETFLNHFHPGSLIPNTDAETLLDLAKQAACIHSISHEQIIKLDSPIREPCFYQTLIPLLVSAKKSYGKGELKPPIKPQKKLFPTESLKDVDKDHHTRDSSEKNSRMMEGSEKKTSQTSTDNPSSKVNNQQEKLWQYVKRKNREPVIGLSELLECHWDQHDPIYLCMCCSLKIPENNIISHVTGFDHQMVYLGLQNLPWIQQEKSIRDRAALFEKDNGYGQAEVLELNEESYNNIAKQNFESVIQTVKPLQPQQDSTYEFPSTSSLSAVQPVDTSVTLHAQHEVYSMTDDFQVMEMEIDKDSEAQPSSVTAAMSIMTKTTSKTDEVPPESNEDVKMTQIKESEAVDNTNTCQTVYRSSKDPRLRVSTSGTNATSLLLDSTGKAVVSLKMAAPSQTAATSHSTVTIPTKSTASISMCTAKPSSSTPDTTNSTAPTSKLTATSSSCNSGATTSTTSATRTASAPMQVAVTSYKAATSSKTGPTVVHKVTSGTAPAKIENAFNNSETVSKTTIASQTMVSSEATAKVTKTSVKCENTEDSTKTLLMKNSVASNADVAPNIPKSSAHTEPSNTSSFKARPSGICPKVGLNQLITVSCEGRKQVYCQLCSVRLKCSSHPTTFNHQLNYVKMKFPGWTAKQSELDSKLGKIVAHLAEIERDVGSRSIQEMEVSVDVYQELAALSGDKAIERLKAMVRQRDLQVSSSPSDAAEVLRQQVALASPCEVSSTDDAIYMPQNEMTGLSTDNQFQKILVQMPEIDSISEEDGNNSPVQSDSVPSLNGKGREDTDLISDHLHLFHLCQTLTNDPKPIAAHSIQDADIAVKMETPQGFANPLATYSESTDKFAQTPGPCQETREKGHQQERNDPELEDALKVPEGTRKSSPIKSLNPDLVSSAASVNIEPQNQSRPSLKAEHVPEPSGCRPGHTQHNASIPIAVTGFKTWGPSHLSAYLKVKGLETKPIIGLASVWECRGVSLNPFFLCESCKMMLSKNEICDHMLSNRHQYEYMRKHKPQFLSFWSETDLLLEMKLQLLNEIADRLSVRERFKKIDAECILLGKESYECILAAPFSEGSTLEIVQKIERDQKSSVYHPVCPPQQNDQQPEDLQGREECLPTQMESAQALETDQTSDNEARQKTEKRYLEDTAMVGDLDGVKQRILSPLNATSVSSKTDSVVSPFPGADTCLSPQEPCRSLPMQPELRPPVCQKRPIHELQGKRADVYSESPSSAVVSSSQTLSMSPKDKCLPTRKRPAFTYVETLVRTCINNLQHEDPFPAKCTHTCSSLQPINQPSPESASESTPVNPAATSILLSPEDKHMGPGSNEQDAASESTPVNPAAPPTPMYHKDKDTRPGFDGQDAASESTPVNHTSTSTLMSPEDKHTGPGSDERDESILIDHLIALVKEKKSQKNVLPAETTNSCANTSPESGVERKWDPSVCVTESTMANTRQWDSKCQLIHTTGKKKPPSSTVVLGFGNHFITPNTNSAFSANNSSHEDYLMGAPEATAVGTMLPSGGTADPSDPQHQGSVDAQSMSGNGSQFQPRPSYYIASNHNPGPIPQPRGYPDTGSSGICQLPINAVKTDWAEPTNQQFMGNYNGQDHIEVNGGSQICPSFSTFATSSPSDTLAASGGYGQYSQMAYVMNGHSGYLSSEVGAGYTTPDNPLVYTGSVHQHEGYATRMFYPRQIYREPVANRFQHSLATPIPPVWVRLEMQQQHSTWTGAALAAGNGYVTSEAAYLGANQYPTPANNLQMSTDLNIYSTNRMVPTQNNNTEHSPSLLPSSRHSLF